MNQHTAAIAFGIAAIILGALSLRHARWQESIAYLCSVIAMAVAIVAALGRPVPLWLVLPALHDVALLGMSPDEPRAVYLWVRRDGDAAPTSVALPWSESDAAKAQDALEQAKRDGTQARWHPGHATAQQGGAGGVQGQGARQGGPEFYDSDVRAMPPKRMTP